MPLPRFFWIVSSAMLIVSACSEQVEDTTGTEPAPVVATTATEPASIPNVSPSTTSAPPTSLQTTTTQEAIIDAECLHTNTTDFFAPVDGFSDFAAEEMGIYFAEDQSGSRVVRLEWGQLGRPEPGDWVPYTVVDDKDLAKAHARLFFNHRRTAFALRIFLDLDFQQHMTDGPGTDAEVAAAWDGHQLIHADGTTEPFPALGLMPPPSMDSETLSEDQRAEAWERAEGWSSAIEEMLLGGIDPLIGLQQQDLVATRADLCALLDTEFAISDEIAQNTLISDLRNEPEVFYRELAVQELLLLNEYMFIVTEVMELPEISWLDGNAVNVEINAKDATTSTAEYLGMWQLAGLDAIWRFRTLMELAEPLNA